MLQTEGTLKVVVNAANNMQDVDTGRQDPYVRFALNLEEKDWPKTFTAKDAGINATWNQTLETPLRGEQEMFIEVMDEETGVDQVIGFCAIKLAPIVQAPGGHVNAIYTIYNIKGKDAGRLHLTITASGFNSPPAQQQSMQPVQGPSYINEEHAKRIKSMRHKALAGDVGTAVLGGALAIGAGFLGHKLYKDHEQKEEQKEQERQQMEEEKERLERERKQMEEQQRRREHEEAEERRRKQEEEQRRAHHGGNNNQGEHHHHENRQHHQEHHHHDHHHGGGGASEWDPVGTYAPGDRVQYHGHTYVCLQGHTSNPTWMPGAAHSLWQPM
ncbi:hypothetical protein K492DRAFT_178509 [Lichtheimia hyalospora FSU 10163]|nr:hypothetical protein K492DRAFT_178509 [Lichtheimia hyalospora FSU 10163]